MCVFLNNKIIDRCKEKKVLKNFQSIVAKLGEVIRIPHINLTQSGGEYEERCKPFCIRYFFME